MANSPPPLCTACPHTIVGWMEYEKRTTPKGVLGFLPGHPGFSCFQRTALWFVPARKCGRVLFGVPPTSGPVFLRQLICMFPFRNTIRKARYLYALLHYATTLHPYNRYSYKCYLSGLPLDNRQDSFSTVGDGQGLVMSRCVL